MALLQALTSRLRSASCFKSSHFNRAYLQRRFDDIEEQMEAVGEDPFGFDPTYARQVTPYIAWIYEHYFRVETHGVDYVPSGRCLIISNHSGQLPYDAAMLAMAVLLERYRPRVVRSMVEHFVTHLPFVSFFFERCGQIVGTPDNCRRLLLRDEPILAFPEGVRGINKLFHERYQLKKFGLGFMRLALETGTPIVPACVIGAEEQAPAIMNLKRVGAMLGLPSLPVTPQALIFPPLGALPYPTKYRIHFGEPMQFSGDPNDEDSEIEAKVAQVESKIRHMMQTALAKRTSIFF